MRGSIRKRGDTWEYTVNLESDPLTNKRRRKSKGGFRTKKECESSMNQLIAKLEKGEYVEYKSMSLKDYFDKWLEYKKQSVKLTTYTFYEILIKKRIVPKIGHLQLTKIRPLNIQEFIDECHSDKSINKTTVKHLYTIINIALNQAVKWQLIPYNPCNSIDAPKKEPKKQEVLTPEEVLKLLEYTENSSFKVMYVPLLLALTCGLRRGEIIALTWDKIDFDNQVIRITESATMRVEGKNIVDNTKTDAGERSVSLPLSTIPVLKEHKCQQLKNKTELGDDYKENNLVCCWYDGREVAPGYLTKTLKKLLTKCKLPDIRFHDLRHIHATLLLLKGVNPKIVSERLGHAGVDITLDLYSHVLPEMQKEAAQKIDDIFETSIKKEGLKNNPS